MVSQSRLIIAILAFVICLTSVAAQAQDKQPEQVHIALKSVDELMADLNYITLLDTKNGKKAWPDLKQLLDIFLDGIHPEYPLRMDIVLNKDGKAMRVALPIDATKKINRKHDFVVNVSGWIGGIARPNGNFFRITKSGVTIWIEQIFPPKNGSKVVYGLVAENRNLFKALKDKPIPVIQPVLDQGYDVAGFVTNDAKGAADRRAAIQALRKQIVPLLKPLGSESDDEFKIRKLATEHQLDELERVYAEVANATLGWTTDVPKAQARLDLEFSALPGTELEATLMELAANASIFGAIEKTEATIFFGRINHALDKMRQKNIGDLLKLIQGAGTAKIDANKEYLKEKKAALTDATTRFIAMLNAGTKMGVIDGFVDITLTDGKRSGIGGIKVADGTALVGVLESLKAGGWKVEVNTEVGDEASWHSIEFPADKELAHALGGNAITVVTTAGALLYATGADAKARLGAVLDVIREQPPADGIVLETWAKVGPWVDFLNERQARKDVGINLENLTDMEKQQRKESAKRRATAAEAFANGADSIHTKIVLKDKKLTGTTTFDTDILRFVGMTMSQFAEKLN
jgi:hypothetical protein